MNKILIMLLALFEISFAQWNYNKINREFIVTKNNNSKVIISDFKKKLNINIQTVLNNIGLESGYKWYGKVKDYKPYGLGTLNKNTTLQGGFFSSVFISIDVDIDISNKLNTNSGSIRAVVCKSGFFFDDCANNNRIKFKSINGLSNAYTNTYNYAIDQWNIKIEEERRRAAKYRAINFAKAGRSSSSYNSKSSSSSTNSESSRCKYINNPTYKNLCRAFTTGNKSYCSEISNSNYRNYCRAVLYESTSYCSSIGDSNIRELCRANVNGSKQYCKEIHNDSSMKAYCKQSCYNISDPNLKELCRALQ